jgi:hypothetical protein
MMDKRRGVEILFEHIIQLDMFAHELEVARRIVADHKNDHFSLLHYKKQIPTLETRVIEQYKRIWSNLDGIMDAESGLARVAMRSIIKSCNLCSEVEPLSAQDQTNES